MHYEVKAPGIEAERVLLSGQNLYAVAVEGKAHLVPGEVFDLFYALKAGVEALKPGPVRPIPGKPAPLPKPATAPKPLKAKSGAGAGVNPRKRGEELRAKLVTLLKDGPLTTAEIGSHIYPEQLKTKLRSQAAWLLTKQCAEFGLIEKREHNGLDKWHLK